MARPATKAYLAEMLGTFLLVFFGCGSVHVAVLLDGLTGLFQVGMVWGVAIMLAIYCIGGISGAHINPAITLALACWGRFPWRQVPGYINAQLVGAILAAAMLFTLFGPWLSEKETAKGVVRGERGSEITAMCYCEYFPNPGPMAAGPAPYSYEEHTLYNSRVPHLSAFLAEVLGTALLALMVGTVAAAANPVGPQRLAPVFIGLTVAVLICVIAPLTQACFNPARDLGPRIFAYFAGWGEVAIPGPNGIGFFTVYILAPIIGATMGMGVALRLVLPGLEPVPASEASDDAEPQS